MANTSPILVIGTDQEDFEMIALVFERISIPNKLIFVRDGVEGMQYLKTSKEKPFIILIDIYPPGMSGVEFRKHIESDIELKSKSVPFIFLSEFLLPAQVTEVYSMSVQGLFDKPNSFSGLEQMMKVVYDYWQLCRHPDQF